MTTPTEHNFEQLAAEWQAIDLPGPAPEVLRRFVASRTRLLRVWVAGELVVTAVAVPALTLSAVRGDAVDALALGSLAVVATVAAAVSWLNWRGVLRASARTTADFVTLSGQRLSRLRRAWIGGWALLAAEVAIFAAWIPHRVAGDASSGLFAWGFLATMTLSAVIALLAVRRWLQRETGRVAALQRELTTL